MSYCKYLRKRKNKPYCNMLKREITLSQCQECVNKEYHFPIKGKMVSKSKKQAIKEKDRYSVFTPKNYCMVCKSTYLLTWNEIFRGRNRSNSMKYGFCLRMCLSCHRKYQEDSHFNELWHKKSQEYFEIHYGTREDFINIFRKNYL